MFSAINRIKTHGYVPYVIFDIGAHHGHWTHSCSQIFNTSSYYLFEAIPYSELYQNIRNLNNPNVKLYNVILNETDSWVDWFEMRNTGDSMFQELTKHFDNCIPTKKPSYALDNIISADLDNISNVFIKIDCQGAEIPILKGASKLLEKTDFILLEIPVFGQYNKGVPSFLEHIIFMDSIGFSVYELTDNHHSNGFNIQADIIFIKKTHPFCKLVQEKLVE